MGWEPGLFKRICDRTGFAVLSDQTTKQWNGIVVRRESAEPRHPQEFVRGRSDKQTVPMPRPRQVEEFVGPLITKLSIAAVAGDQALNVESSVRFLPGDHIGIVLDTGDIFRAVVMTVPPGATQLNLTAKMPYSAAAGNVITDYSAVSTVEVD